MGSAASAGRVDSEHQELNAEQCRELVGPLFDSEIFDREARSGTISLETLREIQTTMHDVYIAFDWSQQMLELVSLLEHALRDAGFKPCFGGQPVEEEYKDEQEEENSEQNTRSRIKSGIANAACVIILLTKRYVEQICEEMASFDTDGNRCLFEFDLVTTLKAPAKVIGVMVDEELRTDLAELQLAKTFDFSLLLDLCAEMELEEVTAALSEAILHVNGSKLRDMSVCELLEGKTKEVAGETVSAPSRGSSEEDVRRLIELADLHHWLEELLGGFEHGNRALQLARSILQAGFSDKDQLQQAACKDVAILETLGDITEQERRLLCSHLLAPSTVREEHVVERKPPSQDDAMAASCLRLAKRLKKLGFGAAALRSLGFSVDHIQQAGFSLEALLAAKYDLDSLLRQGWKEAEIACAMRTVGRKPTHCRAYGLSLTTICETFYVSELLAAGMLQEPLPDASLEGRLVAELADLGLSCKQLLAKRVPLSLLARYPRFFPVQQLLALGYTPLALCEAGCPVSAVGQTLVAMGYSVMECLEIGLPPHLLRPLFPLAQFLEEGVPPGVLQAANFSLADLQAAGLSGKRLRREGFSTSDLLASGLRPADVFSLSELRAQGVSVAQLRGQGCSLRSLAVEGGLPLSELLAAGATCEEVQAAGLLLPPTRSPPPSTTPTAAAGVHAHTLRSMQCVHTLSPEKDEQALCVASCPTVAAVGTQGGGVLVWDLSAQSCVRRLHGHSQAVLCLAFLDYRVDAHAVGPSRHRGLQLLSGSADLTLRLWNVATGRCVGTFIGHSRSVRAVAVLADLRRAVSGSYDDSVRLWDVRGGQCLAVFHGHEGAVRCLAVLPGGKLVVSGSADASLRLWCVDRKREKGCVHVLRGHTDWVNCVVPHPVQRRLVVSGGEDGTLRTWDVASAVCLRVLDMRERPARGLGVTALCLFPQERGRWAVAADTRGVLSLCDLGHVSVEGEGEGEDGAVCGALADHGSYVHGMHGSYVLADDLELHPLGGVHLLTVGHDGLVKVWAY